MFVLSDGLDLNAILNREVKVCYPGLKCMFGLGLPCNRG